MWCLCGPKLLFLIKLLKLVKSYIIISIISELFIFYCTGMLRIYRLYFSLRVLGLCYFLNVKSQISMQYFLKYNASFPEIKFCLKIGNNIKKRGPITVLKKVINIKMCVYFRVKWKRNVKATQNFVKLNLQLNWRTVNGFEKC